MRTTPPANLLASELMAANTGSEEPDMIFVGEILEEISRHPPAIQARKLLVEHYISVGWFDAATDNVKELQNLAPRDPDVKGFLDVLSKKPETPAPASTSLSVKTMAPTSAKITPKPVSGKPIHPPVQPSGNFGSMRQDLVQGYTKLQSKARSLIPGFRRVNQLLNKSGLPQLKNTNRIDAIVDGRKANTKLKVNSARSVAQVIKGDPGNAISLSIADMEGVMEWMRESHGNSSATDNDTIRDALVKRVRSVEAVLPDNFKFYPEIALMHVQHEHLGKTYANENQETMLGDPIKDIPRENFWVTEDNYAWDMEELVQAITANGGTMRNPLSREIFTPKDIGGIVWHPLGKQLAALQVEQREMSKGVRPETITQMEKLAAILLDDQSADTLPSRHAVDEFLAYIATLPRLEQKAIDGLRCPAKDSHTGQSYDFTIGDTIRDAKGNRVCFHKAGDFIKQAAAYLRKKRGASPVAG